MDKKLLQDQQQNYNANQGSEASYAASSQHQSSSASRKKRGCCGPNVPCMWFSGVCGIIFVIVAAVGGWGIGELINAAVKQQAVMAEGTKNIWAQIPGESGVNMQRHFNFYKLANPMDMFLRGKKPQLVLQSDYRYQEFQNFTDRVYNQEYDQVQFNLWQYFHGIDGRTGQDRVSTVNIGALGVWYQLKHANQSTIALQTLGTLFYGLYDQIFQGVQAQYLQTVKLSRLNIQAFINNIEPSLSPSQKQVIRYDYNFGLGSTTGVLRWIDAALQQSTTSVGARFLLRDYFNLTNAQMDDILTKLSSSINTATQQIINKQYCQNKYPQFECNEYTFLAAQWAEQGITLNPPLSTDESITTSNDTAYGFPEISYFVKNMLKDDPELNGTTFSVEWARSVTFFYKTMNSTPYVRAPYSLLHIGNLQYLLENGDAYAKTRDAKYAENIRARFNLTTPAQARVLYLYVKYIVEGFAKDVPEGGSIETLGLGALSSQALYQMHAFVGEYLQRNITSMLMLKRARTDKVTCSALLGADLSGDAQAAARACALPALTAWDDWSMAALYAFVAAGDAASPLYAQLTRDAGLTDAQVRALLADNASLVQFVGKATRAISAHYACQIADAPCSQYELAYAQWAYGNVTQNVPPELRDFSFFAPFYADGRNGTTTVADWAPTKFAHAYEYAHFAAENADAFGLTRNQMFTPSRADAQRLLSFETLFSASVANYAFVWARNASLADKFYARFSFNDSATTNRGREILTTYLRWVVINVALGGLSTEKTVNEYLFGWREPLALQIKAMNPQLGGDPSTNPIVMLGDPNVTYADRFNWPQVMRTGRGDVKRVRTYISLWDCNYTVYNKTWFDGNESHWQFLNPFNERVYVDGTDGGQSQPFQKDGDQIHIYISSLFKGGAGVQVAKEEYAGFETFRYNMDKCLLANASTCPQNAVQFEYGLNGVHNISAMINAPVFLSNMNFADGDPALWNAIDIYHDTDMKKRVERNEYNDRSFLNAELTSGAFLRIQLKLQANALIEPDTLFQIPEPIYIPITSFYRGMNMTDEQVDNLIGPIKIGNSVKVGLIVTSSILGAAMLAWFGYQFYVYRKERAASHALGDGVSHDAQVSAYSERQWSHIVDTTGKGAPDNTRKNKNNGANQGVENYI